MTTTVHDTKANSTLYVTREAAIELRAGERYAGQLLGDDGSAKGKARKKGKTSPAGADEEVSDEAGCAGESGATADLFEDAHA